MTTNDYLTWSGWLFGILGVVVSTYFGVKAENAKKRLQTVEWAEIHAAASFLARKLKQHGVPWAYLATDARGGIIARLIDERFHADALILIGVVRHRSDMLAGMEMPGFKRLETPKWIYFIPEKILLFLDYYIVIVDDATFTGSTLVVLKSWLEENGAKNIRSCTILASDVSIKQEQCADYFWSATSQIEMIFPWGRMR